MAAVRKVSKKKPRTAARPKAVKKPLPKAKKPSRAALLERENRRLKAALARRRAELRAHKTELAERKAELAKRKAQLAAIETKRRAQVAAQARRVPRPKKPPLKKSVRLRMRQELAALRESAVMGARELGLGPKDVKSYLYPRDGRAIVSVTVPTPSKKGWPGVRRKLVDMAQEFRRFPKSTFFQASFLLDPGTLSPSAQARYEKLRGLLRLATHASRSPDKVLSTLLIIADKLRAGRRSFPHAIYFRIGRDPEGKRAFKRKAYTLPRAFVRDEPDVDVSLPVVRKGKKRKVRSHKK